MRAPPKRSEPAEQNHPNSLFGEILDWMLAPLLFLWPISIAVIYHIANDIADEPHDRALAENARAVSRLTRIGDGKVTLNLPGPARELLRHDEQDSVYYQVRGLRGEVVAGDAEIPAAAPELDDRPDTVYFLSLIHI